MHLHACTTAIPVAVHLGYSWPMALACTAQAQFAPDWAYAHPHTLWHITITRLPLTELRAAGMVCQWPGAGCGFAVLPVRLCFRATACGRAVSKLRLGASSWQTMLNADCHMSALGDVGSTIGGQKPAQIRWPGGCFAASCLSRLSAGCAVGLAAAGGVCVCHDDSWAL